jgi:3-methyladenine DNA glycosylase Mpg
MLLRVRLTEVAAYEGATKSTSPGASYAAGIISISTKFGQNMIDIATGFEGKPSCITIRGGELTLDDRVETLGGPGKITKALGITTQTKHGYNGISVDNPRLWLQGDAAVEAMIRVLKGNSDNCVGIYKI